MAESTPNPSDSSAAQPSPADGGAPTPIGEAKTFAVGDRVRVVALPPYVKTAERMPMLRPPSVISLGEEGIIINRHPGNYWSVRLDRGAFLLEEQYLERVAGSDRTADGC